MSAATVTIQEPELRWGPSARGRLGMYCLIAAETAIFTIFVVAYLFYLGKSLSGPTPAEVLHVPDLVYYLPAFEQRDHSSCRPFAAEGKGRGICAVVVSHAASRGHIPGWHSGGVAPA